MAGNGTGLCEDLCTKWCISMSGHKIFFNHWQIYFRWLYTSLGLNQCICISAALCCLLVCCSAPFHMVHVWCCPYIFGCRCFIFGKSQLEWSCCLKLNKTYLHGTTWMLAAGGAAWSPTLLKQIDLSTPISVPRITISFTMYTATPNRKE